MGTCIGSDNGLAPTRQQAIIWTNDTYTCILFPEGLEHMVI